MSKPKPNQLLWTCLITWYKRLVYTFRNTENVDSQGNELLKSPLIADDNVL